MILSTKKDIMDTSNINIFRSAVTSCWEGDLNSGIERIDDRELGEIAEHGYNGIWIHQPLRDYTPSKIFPEFGHSSDKYLLRLEELINRAARYGIKIYMYLLEPRAMEANDPFWENHQELKGQFFFQEGFNRKYYALCSSLSHVREYLFDSLKLITKRLDMNFFCITAAEDFNTCIGKLCCQEYAKKGYPSLEEKLTDAEININCPQCSQRKASEIIAELINTLYDGISAGNPSAKLLAWDWGWRKLPWQNTEKEILDSLNKNIIYVSDFEIGGSKNSDQLKGGIYEYSLSYTGPAEVFSELTSYAREQKLITGAKFQIGTTHELASVPNLPLIRNLWKKIDRAKSLNIHAAIATWNIGTYRTLNTYLFGHAFNSEKPMKWEEFVDLAFNFLGIPRNVSDGLVKAWDTFSEAMSFFPYSVPLLYFGPINYSPSYWLPPCKTKGSYMGLSCIMWERGDNLDLCLGPYSLEEVISSFTQLVSLWQQGVTYYEKVKSELDSLPDKFVEEYNSAVCTYHVYRSSLNIFKLYSLCRDWQENMLNAYIEICEDEVMNCIALLPLLEKDFRLGMHLECKEYMFDRISVAKKINKLKGYIEDFKKKKHLPRVIPKCFSDKA